MELSTRASDHIYTLHRTPFALAPLIHSFYDNCESIEKDILLSYLILPLVSYKPMQKFLAGAKRSSSLRTMAADSSRLLGLALRGEEFKSIKNSALLILTAEKSLKINSDMSVISINKIRTVNSNKDLLRYSSKLALVFSGEDVFSIYRNLGLKSL